MAGLIKLVVGDRIEFEVKFSLNDGGEDKTFRMRLTARRQTQAEQERDLRDMSVQDFLAARGVALQGWVGRSPLQTEEGEPVPPGPEALEALYALVVGMASLVLVAYLKANGAQGAAGN